MNSISHSISSKLRSEWPWIYLPCQFGVMGATKFPKRIHSIILSDFHDNYWPSSRNMLNQHWIFWKNTFINFKELLCRWFIHVKHFQSTYFEALIENCIYYPSYQFLLDSMRFDYTACTVVQHSSSLSHWGEEKAWFSLKTFRCITTMNSISERVFSECTSDCVWHLALCYLSILRPHYLLKNGYCILSYKVHTNDHVRRYVGYDISHLSSIEKLLRFLRSKFEHS